MSYLKTFTTMALAAGAFWVAGQDAWSQGQAQPGTYTLVEIDGRPLPVVTDRKGDCQEEVLSATLILGTDGEWELNYTERETCGADVDEDLEDADGHYRAEGEMIHFSDDTDPYEPDDLDIDELGMGTVTADGMTVRLQDQHTTLTFRRS